MLCSLQYQVSCEHVQYFLLWLKMIDAKVLCMQVSKELDFETWSIDKLISEFDSTAVHLDCTLISIF